MSQAKMKRDGGFTLIEMLVAVTVFLVTVTSGIVALTTVYTAYNKTAQSRLVAGQLSAIAEYMSRSMRTGMAFTCGATTISDAQTLIDSTSRINCFNGNYQKAISFVDQDNRVVVYGWDETANTAGFHTIFRTIDGGARESITESNSLEITNFQVALRGAHSDVGIGECTPVQPYIAFRIEGAPRNVFKSFTKFSVQASVASRILDLPKGGSANPCS